VILADLNSPGSAKKPMISKKFLVAVVGFAVIAFCAVLGSIFLKESLDQSSASKTAIQATDVSSERPGVSGSGGAPSTPADELTAEQPTEGKPSEEAGEKEIQAAEKP